MVDIYLDTCLWNALFEQSIEPVGLMARLRARDCGLVLSDENLFELARTFWDSGPTGLRDGAAFFSYLMGFITASIRITKDNMAMVAAEMTSIQWQLRIINPFLTADDHDVARTLIEDHANGRLSNRTREHVGWRGRSNESGRLGIALYIDNAPALRKALESVSEDDLPKWIQ